MKDFLTSLNKTATLTKIKRPFSALPKVWIGFIIAGVFLLVELIGGASGYDMDDLLVYLIAIGLVGMVYWHRDTAWSFDAIVHPVAQHILRWFC